MIKAVIMAGGEGTRLRPLTCNRPKPMIPVLNKPALEYAITLLKKYGIKDIVISLFFLPEIIQNYFGDGSDWDVKITYSVEETPRGTAGGVKQAVENHNDTVLVLSGDGITDFDLAKILDFHKKKKSSFTIALKHESKPVEYGIVVTDEKGRVEKFLEKPAWSEVFTDTANTGMYIIEPQVIKNYIHEKEKFDFSLNLFPLLQKKKIPIYGYIADGYWCDIGNLTSYHNVQQDLLEGLAKVDFPGIKIKNHVWAGSNVEIDPEAKIKGKVILGNFVKIKKGAEVSEFSVIGDNCVIEENASVRKSVVLHSSVIGPNSELRGAIIGKRCLLQEGVSVYEGSVVSDDCRIGRGVTISSSVRVWPDKIIEAGTNLATDLIWGETEKKTLFGSQGIEGSFNIKITPEFSSRVGSAFGAFLGKNAKVIISRDTTSAARLVKRALTAGLLSMGIDVYDMEIESVPIIRHSMKFINADLGIHIQILPLTGFQFIRIELFNKYGFQLSLNEEKKIENIFYRGDYPRKDASELGHLTYPTHYLESYFTNIKNYINIKSIKERKWNIIIDCFNGASSHVVPELLEFMGCVTTVLRGQIKELISEADTKAESKKSLHNMIRISKINRDLGIIIGSHGTQITIVDEVGKILSPDDVAALLINYYLKYTKNKKIFLPVQASENLEKFAVSLGGKVTRVSSKLRAPEKIIDIFLKKNQECYPYLMQEYDPIIVFLVILEFLSLEKKSLYEIKEKLPQSNVALTSINCTTHEKAAVMRLLTTNAQKEKIQLIDGIKISKNNAWVLVLPDAVQSLIHIYAEGKNIESRDKIMDEYLIKIKKYKNDLSNKA